MSKRIGNCVVIEAEDDRKCQLCGKVEECRPYGPGGIDICYGCGMKDPSGTQRRMAEFLFGDKPTSVVAS